MNELTMPPWLTETLASLGSVGAFIGLMIYYVPRDFLPRFVKSQETQAVAMASIAESLRSLPQKDDLKFQEIIVGQEMLNDRLDAIADKIDGLRTRDDAESARKSRV